MGVLGQAVAAGWHCAAGTLSWMRQLSLRQTPWLSFASCCCWVCVALRCWTEQEEGIIDDTTAMVIYLTHATTPSAAGAHGSSSLTSSTAGHGSGTAAAPASSSSASSSSAAKDLATRLGTGLRLGKGSSGSGAKQSGSGTGAAAGGLLGYKRS